MKNIVPEILTLDQYIKLQKKEEKECFRPKFCPCCGKAGLWIHGYYDRKADRISTSENTHNPVLIFRFFCSHCNKTCSVLPECIPPRRWYLWDIQQTAAILAFTGKSLAAIAKEITPSRHTISRWIERLKEQFLHHKDALCQCFIALGRTNNFTSFWSTCFKTISLSKAMLFCHVTGVNIP